MTKPFAAWLQLAMADKRISQADLARRLYGQEKDGSRIARNRGLVSSWVSGKVEPHLETKHRIAKALGVSLPHELDEAGTSTSTRIAAQAEGVVVIVINGNLGSGFSVQVEPGLVLKLPELLRDVADQIDASVPQA